MSRRETDPDQLVLSLKEVGVLSCVISVKSINFAKKNCLTNVPSNASKVLHRSLIRIKSQGKGMTCQEKNHFKWQQCFAVDFL